MNLQISYLHKSTQNERFANYISYLELNFHDNKSAFRWQIALNRSLRECWQYFFESNILPNKIRQNSEDDQSKTQSKTSLAIDEKAEDSSIPALDSSYNSSVTSMLRAPSNLSTNVSNRDNIEVTESHEDTKETNNLKDIQINQHQPQQSQQDE